MKDYVLMLSRHAVRSYLDKPIEEEKTTKIEEEIAACNKESGLHFQFVKNEPNAFDGFMAHYGKFKGVKNYVALIGKNTKMKRLDIMVKESFCYCRHSV